MFPIVWIETARSFGFNKRKDTALVLLTLGFYLFFINYATNSTYKLNYYYPLITCFAPAKPNALSIREST